jgi:predicted metal-dependent HD superfamily phosphohydrolase
MTTLARWNRLWAEMGVSNPDEDLFHRLRSAYEEPHRHYHTLRHLEECLAQLDIARSLAVHPGEVELALWFHDAIYDVRRHDNEERCAEWVWTCATKHSLPGDICDRVRDLVLATRHDGAPTEGDQQLLVDIDLSILGATEERYREYDAAIRKEYDWVPLIVFKFKRRSVMQGFLKRPHIFTTRCFADRYEKQARENIERSLNE